MQALFNKNNVLQQNKTAIYRTIKSNWKLIKTESSDLPFSTSDTNINNSIVFVQFGRYSDSESSNIAVCQVFHKDNTLAAQGKGTVIQPEKITTVDAVSFAGAYGKEINNTYGWMVCEVYVPR